MKCLEFYEGGTDHKNRTLNQLRSIDDYEMEHSHDIIQWLFPLPEPSQHFAKAPVLTEDEISVFNSRYLIRVQLLLSLQRYLRFLGLSLHEDSQGIRVVPTDRYSEQASVWMTPHNHNFKRITRVIRCLNVLGLSKFSLIVFDFFDSLYHNDPAAKSIIGERAYTYWRNAAYIA